MEFSDGNWSIVYQMFKKKQGFNDIKEIKLNGVERFVLTKLRRNNDAKSQTTMLYLVLVKV